MKKPKGVKINWTKAFKYRGTIATNTIYCITQHQYKMFQQIYQIIKEQYTITKKPVKLKDILKILSSKDKKTITNYITLMASIHTIYDVEIAKYIQTKPLIWFEERQTKAPFTNKNNYQKVKQIYPHTASQV